LVAGSKGKEVMSAGGALWVWNADTLRQIIAVETGNGDNSLSMEVKKMMKALEGEESDVVAWVGTDGTIALRSIVVCTLLSLRVDEAEDTRIWIVSLRPY
jgi:uncharacterized membrane protein